MGLEKKLEENTLFFKKFTNRIRNLEAAAAAVVGAFQEGNSLSDRADRAMAEGRSGRGGLIKYNVKVYPRQPSRKTTVGGTHWKEKKQKNTLKKTLQMMYFFSDSGPEQCSSHFLLKKIK